MTDRQTDPYGYDLELAERRRQWEQQRKAEAERREREQKQRELQQYLTRRGKDHVDHTGEQPTREDLEHWRAAYLDKKEAEFQAERARKLAESEKLYP